MTSDEAAAGSVPQAVADHPAANDLLAFSPYERAFTNLLAGTSPHAPFVAGVFGRWGSGKSTFIVRVMNRLIRDGEAAVLFQPWLFDSREEVWKALIFSVLQYLEDLAPGGNRIAELEDLLIGLANAGVEQAAKQVGLPRLEDGSVRAVQIASAVRFANTFRQQFRSAIRKVLAEKTSPRLYVFVDDLDRCSPEACVSAIEAIKLFFDIPGCVFVLGIDRELVRAGIAKKYENTLGIDGEEYLEKVIQLPFSLPPISEKQFLHYARQTAVDYELEPDVVWLLASFSSRNPRRFKRMLNCFLLVRAGAQEIRVEDGLEGRKLAWLLGLRQYAPQDYLLAITDPEAYLARHDAWFQDDEPAPGHLARTVARNYGKFFEGFTLERLFPDAEELRRYLWLTDLTTSGESPLDPQEPLDYFNQTLQQWESPESPVGAVQQQIVDASRRRVRELVSEAGRERIGVATVLGWPQRRRELDGLADGMRLDAETRTALYEDFFKTVRSKARALLLVLGLVFVALVGPKIAQYAWFSVEDSDVDRVRSDVAQTMSKTLNEAYATVLSDIEAKRAPKKQEATRDTVVKWRKAAEDAVRRRESSLGESIDAWKKDEQPLASLPVACTEFYKAAVVEARGEQMRAQERPPQGTMNRLIEGAQRDLLRMELEPSVIEPELSRVLWPLFESALSKQALTLTECAQEDGSRYETEFTTELHSHIRLLSFKAEVFESSQSCLDADEDEDEDEAGSCEDLLVEIPESLHDHDVRVFVAPVVESKIDDADLVSLEQRIEAERPKDGGPVHNGLDAEERVRRTLGVRDLTIKKRAELLRTLLLENILWLLGLFTIAYVVHRNARAALQPTGGPRPEESGASCSAEPT